MKIENGLVCVCAWFFGGMAVCVVNFGHAAATPAAKIMIYLIVISYA